jgi:tetratricopeptide (TPR) repeat protein
MMNAAIELEIGTGAKSGSYVVRVVSAAAGGEPTGTLDLDVEEALGRRGLLEATVLASAVARRSVSAAEQPVRDIGRQLFEALFTGPIYGMYRASLGVAQQRGTRLRVVLRLAAPELAALPWEMLFDPETETYLCRHEPLVRHVPAPYTPDPLEVHAPLRILGLVSSPRDMTSLDVDAEKRQLAEALAGPVAEGLVEVTWVAEATWAQVHARLLAGEWHVLHFVGHGGYDTATDAGVLALVGADGRADLVDASRLADLLGEARPAPRLVVLNSCSSGESGTTDLFSGTAAALVRSGISAVAAMQFAISDTAAIAFARGFYTAIAHGRSVDEAARSGRISILGVPRSLEWVTPVLYVRGEATQLFTFADPSATSRQGAARHKAGPGDRPSAQQLAAQSVRPGEQAMRRQAELRALYVEARAELRLEHFGTAVGLLEDLLAFDPEYADAEALRDTALRGQQLTDAYGLGIAAQEAGDWGLAVRQFGAVLQADPAYRDAAARKEACLTLQRVADLQAELRHHVAAGWWQAVLDVSAELTRLDPSAADADGLATRARAALEAEQRATDLERRYAQARAAEDGGDWTAATHAYDQILQADPAYRDVAARRDSCRDLAQVADLQSDLEGHVAGGNWAQVAAAIRQLGRLDPGVAGNPFYTELAARARQELAASPPLIVAVAGLGIFGAVSWHPNGSRIAVAGFSIASVYDISGEKHERPLEVKAGSLNHTAYDVAFSPDGTRLATTGRNVRVWDATDGQKLLEIRYEGILRAVAFSPDGTRIAAGGYKNYARIWDAASGQQLREFRQYEVCGVAFSPDGTRFATASLDKTARIWDTASGQQLLEVRHEGHAEGVAFSPDETRFATVSRDKTARIWDAASGEQLLEIRNDIWWFQAVAFSPDGTWLATASRDKTARIWDAASGQQLQEIPHEGEVVAVAFSPDGTRLATTTASQIRISLVAR